MATSLALAFGLMIAFLLLIGGVAAYATSQFAARVSHLGVQTTRRTLYLSAIDGAVQQLREGVSSCAAALDTHGRDAMAGDMHGCVAKIDRNIGFLSASARSKEEAALLAEFDRSYRQYVDARPRWLELAGAGRSEEAAQWRRRALLPAGSAMEQALQELERLRRETSDALERRAIAEARSLRIILIGGLAVALLVGVTAAVAISRGIALPLGQTACAAGDALILAIGDTSDAFSKF